MFTLSDSKVSLLTLSYSAASGVFLSGKVDSWNLQRIFKEELSGVVVGFCLGLSVFAVPWMVKFYMFIREKVKKHWREDRHHDAPSVKTDPGEHLELCGGCGAKDKGSIPADCV